MVEQNARRALSLSHRGYVLDLGQDRFQGPGPELIDDPKVADLYLGGGCGPIEAAHRANRSEAGPDLRAPAASTDGPRGPSGAE